MSWAEYEQLLAGRGDQSVPRLKYATGYLTLKMPTFEHGQLNAIIVDLMVAILNQQLRDYIHTTPVTLQIPEQAGIEPDHCFWLNNWAAVNGKSRINLATDPPPDIAIEVDVTNFTNVADYQPFQVAEVWLIRGDSLAIFALTAEGYHQTNASQFFFLTSRCRVYTSKSLPQWLMVRVRQAPFDRSSNLGSSAPC